LTLIFFLRRGHCALKPEGEARVAHAVNERERAIAGTDAGEPQARMPALHSAQLFWEIAGRICRQ